MVGLPDNASVQMKKRAFNVGVFTPEGHAQTSLVKCLTGNGSSTNPTKSAEYLGHEFVFFEHPGMALTRFEGEGLIAKEVVDKDQVLQFVANSKQRCPNLDIIILITTSRVTVANEVLLQVLVMFKLPVILLIDDMYDNIGVLNTEHVAEYAKYGLYPNACLYVDFRVSQDKKLDAVLSGGRKTSAKLVALELAVIAESLIWKS